MQDSTFRDHWLKRLGLTEDGWQQQMQGHVQSLPFLDADEKKTACRVVGWLLEKLPARLRRDRSEATQRLAEAFGRACLAFWQCGSAFPAFPQNYAVHLHEQLRQPVAKRQPSAQVLADLLVESSADGVCGLNRLELAEAEVVRASERLVLEGRFEDYITLPAKYEEYVARLRDHAGFKRDWEQLRQQYPVQTAASGILHRTLIPERNWARGPGAAFDSEDQQFQAAFDLFCWKYYLWGMKNGEPLLLKPSVVFTPYGTQIFIPGYLSFDARRDLDFRRINQLHKARGVTRQGPGFSTGRMETAEKKKRVKAAAKQARRKGLKGDQRYEFISQKSGVKTQGDHRSLRRLAE